MSKSIKYIFNPGTLSYEVKKRSRKSRLFRSVLLILVSLGMSAFYAWIYCSVLEWELPKTALLKKTNAEWCSKVEVLNRQLDEYDRVLTSLQQRDDDIYRSIFGMQHNRHGIRRLPFSA